MYDRIAVILGKNRLVAPGLVAFGMIGVGTACYKHGKRKGYNELLDEVNESYRLERREDPVKDPNQGTLDDLMPPVDGRELHPAGTNIASEISEEIPMQPSGGPLVLEAEESDIRVITDMKIDSISVVPADEGFPGSSIELIDPEEPEPVLVNVFSNSADPWDQEAEEEHRRTSPEQFYILHYDEFHGSDTGFRQSTLSYFKEDDMLVDELNTPLYGWNELLGELKFGYGSNDPNSVFIRNEAMRMEWEVLLHTGSYATEILGQHIEAEFEEQDLKHSAHRRFRME